MILSKSSQHAFNPDEFRKDLLKNGKIGTLLSIVPTRRRIRNLSRYFIQKSPSATDSLYIETIETAAVKLLKSSDVKFNLIKDPVSIVILRECFQEIKDELLYFPKENLPTGTLDKLKNLISEYKRHPIYVTDLIREIEQDLYNEGDVLKVKDIILLYDAYNRKCEQLSLREIGDVYPAITGLSSADVTSLFKKTFINVNTIIIEGYNQFSESELDLINSLADVCDVFIDFDFFESNENVFSHITNIKDRLLERGWAVLTSDRKSSDLRNYFGKNLSVIKSSKIDFSNNISVIECSTREKEVEIIAKQIKKLLKTSDSKPHDICVVFNDISKYSDLIRDKFNSCSIPFNLTDRKLLSSSIPVSALLFYLQIKLDDFYYKNILRAFSNGFITLFKNHSRVNSNNLLECAAKLKIAGGLNNWKMTLSKTLNDLPADDKDYSHYKWALEDINIIAETLKPFDESLTPEEFHGELLKLISRLNIVENLTTSKYNVEENARGFQKFLTALTELLDINFNINSTEKHPLSFYYTMLCTAVNRERFSLAERSNFGVFISNLDEARGLKFDYVFLGGLIDGELPTPYKPELFVLRKKNEKKISKAEIQQIRERHLFYQTLCSSWRHVYLSYPLWEEKKQYEKSVFLKEVENIAVTSNLFENEFSKVIASKEELLRNFNSLEEIHLNEIPIPAESIKENITIEKQREFNSEAVSRFTGYLLPETDPLAEIKKDTPAILENIRINLDNDRTYSISQFEKYASCPFRYFSEKMLRLNIIDEPKEEIEKTELGTLLHNILCEFYKAYGLEKAITDIEKSDAIKLIFEIAEKLSENYFKTDKDFYEKEKVFGINGKKEDSIIYKFIENEIASFDGFVPWQLEYTFNGYEINGVKIRGQIDRIDINRELKQFRIIDYKLSGKIGIRGEIKKGLSLQIPIYIAIAQMELFKLENEEYTAESGIIYSLKISEKEFGQDHVIKSDKVEEMVTISIEKMKQYSEEIKKGHFNMSGFKNNGVCKFCDFSNICRVV